MIVMYVHFCVDTTDRTDLPTWMLHDLNSSSLFQALQSVCYVCQLFVHRDDASDSLPLTNKEFLRNQSVL